MVAVQGVAVTDARIEDSTYRIAYAHYSRSDPETRNSGSLIHLVSTLFRDVYPAVDQFISLVDVRNAAGLRLSFGKPWPTCVRRLFLPFARWLRARGVPRSARRSTRRTSPRCSLRRTRE